MPQFLRTFVPGGTFFFTVTLLERRLTFLTEHPDDLRAGFNAKGGMRFAFPPYGPEKY
jgi:putative transposase